MEDTDPPELATNEDWRAVMRKARGDHLVDGKKMTQDGLCEAVFKVLKQRWPKSHLSKEMPTQAAISKVESGETKSSSLVTPICTVLSIPLPAHYVDDENRAWAEAGQYLRHRFPDEFQRHLEMIEERIRSAKAAESANDERPLPC